MAKKDIGKFTGEAVTFQIPNPAGGVKMETFIPWTLVKRGVRARSSRHSTRHRRSRMSLRRSAKSESQHRTAPWCGRWGWRTIGSAFSTTGALPR